MRHHAADEPALAHPRTGRYGKHTVPDRQKSENRSGGADADLHLRDESGSHRHVRVYPFLQHKKREDEFGGDLAADGTDGGPDRLVLRPKLEAQQAVQGVGAVGRLIALLGERYRDRLEKSLTEHGFEPIFLPDNPYLDKRLASHADLSVFFSGKELIVKDGAVVGIYAEDKDGFIQIDAKAVYLATGGYAGNPEMLVKYAHVASTDFVKDCGIPGRNGDGINMALAAGGAEWTHMGVLQNFGPITKNDTYASQLYSATAAAGFRFNEQGKRYADESLDVANFAFSGNIMQQQKASFSIATKAQIDEWSTVGAPYGGGLFMVGLGPIPGLWDQLNKELASSDPQVFECKDIDEVAAKAGVDPDTLKASIERYNEMCAAGVDEDFLKAPEWLTPVGDEGPYYLFKHCIGVFTTCDGVHVNENAQVLNADGEPVPGLFAGGMDAGGLMGDAYDVSVAPTSAQGWCVFCGRAAAKFVAENMV